MALDPAIAGFLESLEVELDAAVAHEEDVAAADLAISLRQDLSMEAAVGRRPVEAIVGETHLPVSEIGQDYVACGVPPTVVVPRAVCTLVAADSGSPPRSARRSLIEILRRWSREERPVIVVTNEREWRGTLVAARSDHVEVRTAQATVFLGLGAISVVRRPLSG